MKEKFSWKIECNHTPETIDRILMPIRKRGLMVNSLNYAESGMKKATCTVQLEIEEEEYEKIFKNMLRIQDILSISKI